MAHATKTKSRENPLPEYVVKLWEALKPLPPNCKQHLAEQIAASITRWAAPRDMTTGLLKSDDATLANHIQRAERVGLFALLMREKENDVLLDIMQGFLLNAWSAKDRESLAMTASKLLAKGRRSNG